jgi:hypothetical protein
MCFSTFHYNNFIFQHRYRLNIAEEIDGTATVIPSNDSDMNKLVESIIVPADILTVRAINPFYRSASITFDIILDTSEVFLILFISLFLQITFSMHF